MQAANQPELRWSLYDKIRNKSWKSGATSLTDKKIGDYALVR